jgi:hypothetical protein
MYETINLIATVNPEITRGTRRKQYRILEGYAAFHMHVHRHIGFRMEIQWPYYCRPSPYRGNLIYPREFRLSTMIEYARARTYTVSALAKQKAGLGRVR